MNIKVIKEEIIGLSPQEAVEEYAVSSLVIHLDVNMPPETMRSLAVHAVIENFCSSWTHDKV